jgi:hypothetical protein
MIRKEKPGAMAGCFVWIVGLGIVRTALAGLLASIRRWQNV